MKSELSFIVINHSVISGIAGAAMAFLPSSVVVVAGIITIGAIWHMYYCIAKHFRIAIFSKSGFIALIFALIVNCVTQLPGVLVLELAETFMPKLSVVTSGLLFFSITYISGFTFSGLLNIIKN